MQTPDTIRTRLAELETAVERIGAAVITARSAYDHAVRQCALSNDPDAVEDAQRVLRASERQHGQAADIRDHAKALLADAIKGQRERAQSEARIEVEADLASFATEAAEIDSILAAAIDRVLRLRVKEQELRRKVVRDGFGEVIGSPDYLVALRSLGTHLTATANAGAQPDTLTRVGQAAANGARYIRRAIANAE